MTAVIKVKPEILISELFYSCLEWRLKMDENIAPQLEELTRALGDLEKTGIRAEFDKLLAFRVPPEVAKESILRKFGGNRKVLKVKDLSGNLKSFEITGRVLDLGEKTFRPQGGATEGT